MMEFQRRITRIILFVAMTLMTASHGSPVSNAMAADDLMDTHEPAAASQFDIRATLDVLPETNEVDLVDAEQERHHHRRHRNHHHRNGGVGLNSTKPDEDSPVVRLQMAENYGKLQEQLKCFLKPP